MSCFPLTVMRPGSPGPAPTRNTFPSLKTQSFFCITRRRAPRRARLRIVEREPHFLSPRGVFNGRDLGWLYLAAPAPKHVRVENGDAGLLEMFVDRELVPEHNLFVRAVRHGHDIHVAELGPALAPVRVSKNVMASHLPPRFDLSPGRNTPV